MIPAAEIVTLLERIAGDTASVIGEPNPYEDDYVIHAEGWTLRFFNDAGQVDYLEFARAPDGRTGEFDEWWKEIDNDPLGALGAAEVQVVEARVQSACFVPEESTEDRLARLLTNT